MKEPSLQKACKLVPRFVFERCDVIPNGLVNHCQHSIDISPGCVVPPRISFPPDMVYYRLEYELSQDGVQTAESMILQVHQCLVPIRINACTQQLSIQFISYGVDIRTRKEQVISCLISFSTQRTTLNNPQAPILSPVASLFLTSSQVMNEYLGTP